MPKSINEASARTSRLKLTKRAVESLTPGANAVIRYDDKLYEKSGAVLIPSLLSLI
jgi:hypothetical protein